MQFSRKQLAHSLFAACLVLGLMFSPIFFFTVMFFWGIFLLWHLPPSKGPDEDEGGGSRTPDDDDPEGDGPIIPPELLDPDFSPGLRTEVRNQKGEERERVLA